MNLLPPEPSANDKISATFMKALMRYIRANTLLNGPGYRTKRGPNGTTLEIGKAAHARQAASAKIPGRFEISSIEVEEKEEGHEEDPTTYTVKFLNPYFDVGGKTYEVSPDESLDPPAVQIEGVHEDDIIVIKIMAAGDVDTSGELDAVSGGINELKNRQLQMDLYTIPLYKIHGGSAVCDFRTGPIAGMGEF